MRPADTKPTDYLTKINNYNSRGKEQARAPGLLPLEHRLPSLSFTTPILIMQTHETHGISSDSGLDKMKQAHATKAAARRPDKTGRYGREETTRMFSPVRKARPKMKEEMLTEPSGQVNEAHGVVHDHRMSPREHRALPPPLSVPRRSSSSESAASTFVPSPLSIGSLSSTSTSASSVADGYDDIKPFHPVNQGYRSPREANAWKATHSDGLNSAAHSSTNVNTGPEPTFRIRPADSLPRKHYHQGSLPSHGSDSPRHQSKPYLVTAGPALQPLGRSESGKWTYSLALTLEDLFHGMQSQFGIVRRLRSGQTKNVVIELDIPPGCRSGTQILCREVGNELPTGKLEDVILVVEELPHRIFRRMGDDLFMDVQIPWSNDLKHHPKQIDILNVDNEPIEVFIDYSREKSSSGNLSIRNAGMPIRERGRLMGRGKLIVRWEILPQNRESGLQGVLSRFFRHAPK